MGTNDKHQDADTVNQLKEFQNKLAKHARVKSAKETIPIYCEAHELFLEGKFHWNHWTEHSISKALKCFDKAIALNSGFGKVYGWLANCYAYLGVTGRKSSWQAFKKAENIIQKGEQIDSSNGELHAARGIVDTFLYQEFTDANLSFKKAFNKGASPHLYHWYAVYLLSIGNQKPAIQFMERALQEDPTNVMFNSELARSYYFNRQYAEALQLYDYTLDLDSSFQAALNGKGWTHVVLEEFSEAHEVFESYQNMVYHEQKNIPQLVFIAAKAGMGDIAHHFLDVLQGGDGKVKEMVTSIDIAKIYYALDSYDEAFFHLKRAVEDGIGEALFIKSDPLWDDLKNDIRYKDLLRQMNQIHSEYYLSDLAH